MKKITFLLLFAIVMLQLNAQHLQFMGVTMGGDIRDFAQSLTKKGLSINYSGTHPDEEWITMSGDFWLFNCAYVLIQAPYADNGTTFVQVSARANKSTYTKLINSLDRKYGRHTTQSDVRGYGDLKCIWRTNKGNITLWRSQFWSNDAKYNLELEYLDYPRVKRARARARARSKARINDL